MGTPYTRLRELIDGYRISQMISVAAELGIADRLADGPKACGEIAESTGSHAPSLYRLMRALASAGVFDRSDGDRFALNSLSQHLRSGIVGSARPWAIHSGQLLYGTWSHLGRSIATGSTAFDLVHGMSVWEHRKRNAHDGRLFHEAMAENVANVSRSVVHAFDFSPIGTVVDIGGGNGALLRAILAANARLRGILFDEESAVRDATVMFADAGLGDRTASVAGDFFESVPAGGDAYILSRILHDWQDDDSVRILRNIGKAMAGKGTLLIVERVLDARAPGVEPSHSDVHMLVMTGGRERTADEYRALLSAAGFRLSRLIPTDSPVGIIEAAPA